MEHEDRDTHIWVMHLLYITERTGLKASEIQRVFELSEEWWRTHPGMAARFMMEE